MIKGSRSISAFLFSALLLLIAGCYTGESKGGGPVYSIGDTGPAGGLIFYIDEADAFDWTYLEAAPQSTEWEGIEWGKYGTEITGTGTALGTGAHNCALIVAVLNEPPAFSNGAAQLCDSLNYNGYGDWFLPSRDELAAIWDNLVDDGTGSNSGFGGFGSGPYWTSSESGTTIAYFQYFDDGEQDDDGKQFELWVRAIRAF